MLLGWRVDVQRGMGSRYLEHSAEPFLKMVDNMSRYCTAQARRWLMGNDSLRGKQYNHC